MLFWLLMMTAIAQKVTVHPQDTGETLINPGLGWVFYQYDDDLRQLGAGMTASDTAEYFPGLGVVYMRLACSFIEPKEGEFRWWVLDTPSQRWIDGEPRSRKTRTSLINGD